MLPHYCTKYKCTIIMKRWSELQTKHKVFFRETKTSTTQSKHRRLVANLTTKGMNLEFERKKFKSWTTNRKTNGERNNSASCSSLSRRPSESDFFN